MFPQNSEKEKLVFTKFKISIDPYFFNQGSLLSLTNKEIRKDYPFIYKGFWEKLWRSLASPKSCYNYEFSPKFGGGY